MSDILERPQPPFDKRISYGSSPQQFAELRIPDGRGPFPLLLVIHGGFWGSSYDLKHIGSFCAALTREGVITCNIEYRRIGDFGSGWPGTFQDITRAADHIPDIVSKSLNVDFSGIAALGHSAGGHLALWLSCRSHLPVTSPVYSPGGQSLSSVCSLAGVCDLRTGWKERLGNGAVARLMGGGPEDYPERYDAGSPIELLPSPTRQLLVHGTADQIVPINQSEMFVEKAERLGGSPEFKKLDNVGHFELIDPESEAWSAVVGAVLSMLEIR